MWELTLRCNAACVHCGSDAGRARPDELAPSEALALCDELAALGTCEVTLSGGEPLLRPDWPAIAQRLVASGVRVDVISNGIALDRDVADRMADLGIGSVSLSVDGPEQIHDALRGVPGAFRRVMAAARHLRGAGVPVGAVTQIGRRNLGALEQIEAALVDAGFAGWQLQLTTPMGRAEGRGLALEPAQVPAIERFLLDPARRGRLPVCAADDIGWMSPSEPELRSLRRPTERVFLGCQAGLSVIGIAADGTVRGCLSMPPHFDEGNVRGHGLAAIWSDPGRFAYNRRPPALTGPCASCAFGRVCRAGCKTLAWSTERCVSENRYCLRLREHG